VPPGDWSYAVTPRFGLWSGPEGPASSAAAVAPPSLGLDSAVVTTLPATVTGALAGFASGQSVSLRLDDPASGTVLSGSVTPSPTTSAAASSVSATLPAGTANGSHTVYAVGSGGEVASATIRVALLVTSAWDVRDASGGGEVDVSAADAFAADALSFLSAPAPATLQPTRFEEYDFNASLPPGEPLSSAEFDFRFGSSDTGQACFHFETRRASTGALIAAHGSAASPVGCTSAQQLFATPLPELADTDDADDLRIRAYVSESLGKPVRVDQAAVSGAIPGRTFTLFDQAVTDQAGGTPSAYRWPLAAAGDGSHYVSSSAWASAFSSSRYLKLKFPNYLPVGASIDGVTLTTAYRPHSTGSTCLKAEAWDGSTLLGTHGSGSSPVSCTSSPGSFQTDAIALPEVTTRAQVNSLVVRLYLRNADSLKTDHDLVRLTVSYTL
jgi:hypothetical protein